MKANTNCINLHRCFHLLLGSSLACKLINVILSNVGLRTSVRSLKKSRDDVDQAGDNFVTYIDGLTVLNQARVICTRIEFCLDQKDYSFLAYQVSQLHQVLASMTGSAPYVQSIQSIFGKLKDTTTFSNSESANAIHLWYNSINDQLIVCRLQGFLRSLYSNICTILSHLPHESLRIMKPLTDKIDQPYLTISNREKKMLLMKNEESQPPDSPKMVVDGTSVINHQLIRFPSPGTKPMKRPLFSRYTNMMLTTMDKVQNPMPHWDKEPRSQKLDTKPTHSEQPVVQRKEPPNVGNALGPGVQRARKGIRDRYVGIHNDVTGDCLLCRCIADSCVTKDARTAFHVQCISYT